MKIIRPSQISQTTGLSKVTVWRLEKSGQFPKRIRLSAGAVGWLLSDIELWLKERAAAGMEGVV